jgi:hypothetical protein
VTNIAELDIDEDNVKVALLGALLFLAGIFVGGVMTTSHAQDAASGFGPATRTAATAGSIPASEPAQGGPADTSITSTGGESSTDSAPAGSLDFVKYGTLTQEGDYVHILGVAKNNTGHDLSYAEVRLQVLDKKGTLIGIAMDNTDHVAADSEWSFNASCKVSGAASCKLEELKGN